MNGPTIACNRRPPVGAPDADVRRTMKPPPEFVGGARVVRWSLIDKRHGPTGNCTHIVVGELQSPPVGVAICQYDDEEAFHLFGCDAEWNSITDTWHATLEDALSAAELEYEGLSQTWNVV